MNRSLRRSALIGAALLLGGWSWLSAPDQDVAAGNARFAEGDYAGAVVAYRRALTGRADPAAVHFAIGTALTRQAQGVSDPAERGRVLGEAEEALRRAIESRDDALRAAAYYNLGNALYAATSYEDAADAYKRALRLDADRDDARYNLELALRQRQRARAAAGGPGQPRPGDQGQPGARPQPGEQGEPQPGEGPRDPGEAQPGDAERPDPAADPAAGAAPDEQAEAPPSWPRDQAGDRADEQPDRPGRDPGPPGATDPGAAADGADRAGPGADRARRSGDTASEVDRRLDALERLSRDLRRQRLRDARRGAASDPGRGGPKKDW